MTLTEQLLRDILKNQRLIMLALAAIHRGTTEDRHADLLVAAAIEQRPGMEEQT